LAAKPFGQIGGSVLAVEHGQDQQSISGIQHFEFKPDFPFLFSNFLTEFGLPMKLD